MYRLSSIIFLLFGFIIQTYAQSPHGESLKIDCAGCHYSSGWLPIRKKLNFNHDATTFPLVGNHSQTDCKACHTSLVFSNAPSECVNCHTDVHSMSVGNNCARCHTPQSWIVDNIPELHEANGFPLAGSHSAPSCVDCHVSETNLRFDRIGNDCINCHRDDYLNAKTPDHQKANYSTNCAECHDPFSSDGWNSELVNHDFFPLTLGHAIQDCKQCHVTGKYSDASPECASCHLKDYSATKEPNHTINNFSKTCTECHSMEAWTPSNFDHNKIYPLQGAHKSIANNCVECHAAGYVNTPNTCVGCHLTDYNTTVKPNHKTAQINTDCKQCHSESAWSPSNFDHNTVYPLQGAHKSIANDCIQCHAAGYVNTPNTCVGCHLTDYNTTVKPNHKTAQIATDCKQCHSESAWSPSNFDHNTVYPLQGAHKSIANECIQCHAAGYVNTPNTCVGCHLTDYNTTVNPNHKSAQFSNDCKQCHTESSWIPSSFNHNTVYPLVGAHQSIAKNCVQCHAAGYVNTPNTCVGCHLTDYNTTVKPNHKTAQLPTDCKQCHTESAWTPSSFDHNTVYPLLGAHKSIASNCVQCHAAGYVNTPNTCVGCHLTDYNTTVNPNHKTAQFPTDCKQCHTESTWTPSSFNHNTIYPLVGAHQPIAKNCVQCHAAGYVNTPNTCVGCHLTDYNTTANPNHKTAQFPTDCKQCHTESAWAPSSFDHNTIYPLLGAHKPIANNCVQCHAAGYVNTPNTCVGCHLTDYNTTTNPNHKTAQFPTDCKQCHTESAWIPSNFDHNTIYPLVGAHQPIAKNCVQCHAAGYVNTPNTCVGCHLTDYNATTNPNHKAALFPTDCKQCHTESAWIPSSFDHNTIYPLVGAHKTIANNCVQCHAAGYVNTPNTCVGCHQTDYNTTTNPNHTAAHFPNDCKQCHTQTAWTPATFNHDGLYFPIYTGSHRNAWTSCTECHTNSSNYAVFSCIDCHQHNNKTKVDSDHRGENGYVYASNACLNCHPRGN